jgi:hypothetical protein
MPDYSNLFTGAYRLGGDAPRALATLIECLGETGPGVQVNDVASLRGNIGVLAELAAFGDHTVNRGAHRLAWGIATAEGIYPASIEQLYRALGRSAAPKLTVPAMNMRAVPFVSACGVFRAMRTGDVGAAIFELSRGEIGFTGQRPHDYATAILCAAIAEEHQGPLFLQGDHFQVSASRYGQDPEAELQAVKDLIAEAISAGFYNIDIDCSTLVDLSFSTEAEQQKLNVDLTAVLARHTRSLEPEGVTISLGGEIGEVGDENSTVAEVDAYLQGVSALLGQETIGLSKLSIQSGTRHGGNVLPDGSFGEMNVDYALIRDLTEACRRNGDLAGCVQHGASMLSLEKISRLPDADCIEVHLAAAFLNAVYAQLPDPLVEEADTWLRDKFADEWKPDWSEAQFLHHARRYPIGPFKRQWWDACDAHPAILNEVEGLARAYFDALQVTGTRELVQQAITHPPVRWHGADARTGRVGDEAQIQDLAD